jgi:hypothetical protein
MISNLCQEILTSNRLLENIPNLFNPKLPITLKFSEACVDFHIYPSLCEEILCDFAFGNSDFSQSSSIEKSQNYQKCFSDIIKLNISNIDTQIIKSVIWHCSSGINARYESNIDPYYLEIWEKISSSFSFHTKTYLSKILKTYGL